MRITHYGHSCLFVETESARILFDPGVYSTGFEQLSGIDAIFVTHSHSDHVDVQRFGQLVDRNPGARLIVAGGVDDLVGGQVATPGERYHINGTTVDALGVAHEQIHPDIKVPTNVGYVINDGALYHPGDSLVVPDLTIDVLGLATAAPWMRVAQACDFLGAVKPGMAIPIHNGLLAHPEPFYKTIVATAPEQTEVRILASGETVDL